MTKSEIDKFEAAQRQLDCAIRLWFVDEDSLAIHTLAYAAGCLLREHGREKTPCMVGFSELDDPFKPGHQASERLRLVRHGPITEQDVVQTEIQRILTLGSTGGASVLPKGESER